MFITAFTKTRRQALSSAILNQSMPPPPHSTSVRSILIRLDLPSGLLPSYFHTKTLYLPLLSNTCYMSYPSQSFSFDHPNDFVRSTEHKASSYVVFSTLLLPRLSWAHISFSILVKPKNRRYFQFGRPRFRMSFPVQVMIFILVVVLSPSKKLLRHSFKILV
jgi:hypothetical protein